VEISIVGDFGDFGDSNISSLLFVWPDRRSERPGDRTSPDVPGGRGMTLRGPGGTPPPASAAIDGEPTALEPLARAVCARYRREFPDEQGRYGDAGAAWCVHDNQWLLFWAAADVVGEADMETQVLWLARILRARAFPLERLERGLQIGAEVVGEGATGPGRSAVATRLLRAAERVARFAADPRPA
jgi:hypothetical protein